MSKIDDTMSRVRYVDSGGCVRELKDSIGRKKIASKFPLEYTDFGVYLLIPVLSGTALGLYLDRRFNTTPLWTTCMIVLGGILAAYNLFAILKKDGSVRPPRGSQRRDGR